MRNFLKIFLRSLGTYLGARGGLTQPLVIVGFNRLVIFITYGMRYFAMEAVSLVYTFDREGSSSTMCRKIRIVYFRVVELVNINLRLKCYTTPHFLILFFDAKRTWQWLQRDKLEPLGVHFDMDKAKLVQSKKASERKAVRKAYEDAVQHRCRVTGENTGGGPNSEESSETEDQKD